MEIGHNKSLDRKNTRNRERYDKLRRVQAVQRNRFSKIAPNCFPTTPEKFKPLCNRILKALKVAAGRWPLFVLKESKIPGAGMGVFVSEKYAFAPANTLIPYPGEVFNEKSEHGRQQKYEVALPQGKVLRASSVFTPGQPVGNFANRIMSESEWAAFQHNTATAAADEVAAVPMQNLHKLNATLIVFRYCCYLKLEVDIPAGDEVLTTYGSSFHI